MSTWMKYVAGVISFAVLATLIGTCVRVVGLENRIGKADAKGAFGFPGGSGSGGGGGGGDITAVTANSPIAGGGASGDVSVSMLDTGCSAGEAWIWDGDSFECTTVFDGDVTAVTVTSPIAGGAASGSAAISLSGTGCNDETGFEFWSTTDGTTWACAAEVGDISGVTASTGLSGGGTSGAVSLSVDPTVVQSRVTGTCAGAGNNIRAVAQDGTVTCDTTGGDVTAVTAGSGLSGGGSSGALSLVVDEKSRLKTRSFLLNDGGNRAAIAGTYGPWIYTFNGTNATVTAGTESGAGNTETFDTGTTTTGRSGSVTTALSNYGAVATDVTCYGARVKIPTNPDGTETFTAYVGFTDSVSAVPTDGAIFEANSTSANWLCRNRSAGTGNTSDSTIAISTSYQYLEVCMNGTTNATYAIDGTVRCTISANMPGAATTAIGTGLFKSAGTTARTITQDFAYIDSTYASRF